MIKEKYNKAGLALGLLLTLAHLVHAPLWILGKFRFTTSGIINSSILQAIGVLITVLSIVFLVKDKSTKIKLIQEW